MRLIHGVMGVSKLVLILLLLVSFIVGALLSYVWTMGYYAPQVFRLPSQANVTIEEVEFFAENATFFNVTVLNPSYSPSPVRIEQILLSAGDGGLLKATATVPLLPHELTPGSSQTFKAYLNWGNYTGQSVNIIALVADGSGATFQRRTPFMNLTAIISLNPSVSVAHLNITVQSIGSPTYVSITKILVNEEDVSALVTPELAPYLLNPNDTKTFTVKRNWIDLQGKDVMVSVQTLQGYTAYKTERAPGPVSLFIVPPAVFNESDTSHFNISVINAPSSPTYVDISEVEVAVFVNDIVDQVVLLNSTYLVADPSPRMNPSLIPTRLICYWDWSRYLGKGAKVTITVRTLQGFQTPPLSEIIP